MTLSRTLSAIVAAAVLTGVAVSAAIGPSSSETPYLVRTVPGIVIKAVLTVGDAVGGYRMVGIPDGLGAFDNGDGTFTLLMNHELGGGTGITRDHGANGAFVSRWTIRKDTLEVLDGGDLIQEIATWNTGTGAYNTPATGIGLSRLCSADLAPVSAFYNDRTGLGYPDHIFMNGEEAGNEGRAFGHLMGGTSYELPYLGKLSWENSVPHPGTGDRTVVVGLDDSGNGQVYVYAGTKTDSVDPIAAAGLSDGVLLGIKVSGLTSESNATTLAPATPFTVHNFGQVASWTGAQLDAASLANGVTGFQRPEDGAWDPSAPNDFYFVTTASFTGASRLWRLRFVDASQPWLGGVVDMLLDGTEGQKMMDNIAIDRRGRILIQEDPGGQDHLAKLWLYDIARDTIAAIAEHDPERFAPGAPGQLTNDEESSGAIDVSSILGEGWFLIDVQAHYATGDSETVQGGQLIALHVPPGKTF